MSGKRWFHDVASSALACALAACASSPTEAVADPNSPDNVELWAFVRARYDADEDGRIARSEYGRDEEHWSRLDKDGDGFVVAGEVAIAPSGPSGRPAGEPSFDEGDAPQVGEWAPDFELEELGGNGKRVHLASYRGKKPVALIFGSYT
jgi:hypothetical protein